MPIDRNLLASKIQRYAKQLGVGSDKLAAETGLKKSRVEAIINAEIEPTGDEVLILADYFKCDYRFLISNDNLAPLEQTEKLFRRHSNVLSTHDMWAIQEFLFLCECQDYLLRSRPEGHQPLKFVFKKTGGYFKGHGTQAADALRGLFGYGAHEVPKDIYQAFRRLGIHIFRRKLEQSAISGMYIKHPTAGSCILVNYSEDIYRQRFSAAHEVAHAILDSDKDYVVSLWGDKDLSEIRANAFASRFLMPPQFLQDIPSAKEWDAEKLTSWSNRLMVNPESLLISLLENQLITTELSEKLRSVRILSSEKTDPELPITLAPHSRERRKNYLERGLSTYYVNLCFDAHHSRIISSGRLAEMLLCSGAELITLSTLIGREILHAD